MKTIETLDNNVFKHLIMTIGELPTSFVDSMSYYEMVAWLVDYIKTQVIPAVNNNAEAVQEIQNWISTLDLQDEVNNKLDEMAESGELAEIIAQYIQLNGVLAYKTIAEMSAAENLVDGSITRVLGNTSYKNGDGAYYYVRPLINTDVVDGFNIVAITNDPTLVAERIDYLPFNEYVADNMINVKFNGAKGDGVTDDTTAIQTLIDNNPHKTLYFPAGDYKISSPLVIKAGNDYQVDLNIDKNARIFASETVDALLTVGETAGGAYTRYAQGGQVNITGGQFDGTNVDGEVIRLNSAQKETRLLFVTVRHVQAGSIGIQINGDGSSDSILQNVIVQGDGSEYDATGVELNAHDNKITGLYCQKLKRGIHINSGGNFLRNFHVLGSWDASTVTSAMFNDCVGIEVDTQDQFFTDIYLDTMATGIKVKSSARVHIKGLAYFFWTLPSGNVTTLFNYTGSDCTIKLSDAWIQIPNNPNGTNKGVVVNSSDVEQYFYYRQQLEIKNSHLGNFNALTSKIDLLLEIENDMNPIQTTPWSTTMVNGSYYPIAYIFGAMEIELRVGNDQIIRAMIRATDTTSLTVTNVYDGAHTGEYKIAILDGGNSANNRNYKLLALKATSNNCSLNPVIKRLSGKWNDQILTCPNFMGLTPLSTPTVLQESSFNPV